MALRTLEIKGPAELHVRAGQLTVGKEDHTFSIPLEDISTIICFGAGIRISTMAMAQVCARKITMLLMDETYSPAGIVTSYEANSRQAIIMKQQVEMDPELKEQIWRSIVIKKITNQAGLLDIIGAAGSDRLRAKLPEAENGDPDKAESTAAKAYFQCYKPGMNRRKESPLNSQLNYGYAIVRNTIIRALIAAGMQTAFGLHHSNQFNAYNLADDLMEPFRPMVDMAAHYHPAKNVLLTRDERKRLLEVLYGACLIKGRKVSVINAIDTVTAGFRRCLESGNICHLCLPDILPEEYIPAIVE